MSLQFLNSLPTYVLVFVRVSAFFAMVPFFSYRNIPNVHKIGLSILLSWMIAYSVKMPVVPIDGFYFLLIIKEAMIGLAIGMIAAILFYAIQVAGSFIDFQMGFAIANVFDPQTGVQTPLMGKFLQTVALLFILSVDGHHLLLDGIYYSYSFVPVNDLSFGFGSGDVAKYFVSTFGAMFVIGFQMSIPIVGSLFLIDVALGIVARTVPQLNIFVVGLPLKIIVAFILLIFILPAFFMSVHYLVDQMVEAMRKLLELLGGT
ncbi:flagellar biosynthetic protein FliR [Fictibacillus sp. Mic-4]|uniref:flagellar biosynthetic protein FliR n=1 Tax=Fictibacillus TaxID=1329200 RepID=UPI00040E7FD7|nr:flagellar biosynthetic protein FliR [Fictibacillus gelatini]